MKFKILLDKYKNGIASEEEKLLIEEELEKYQMIEEYLTEKIDMDFISLEKDEGRIEDAIDIKRSVNSRLRKAVFKTLAVFMISILAIFFILSPIIGSFYYNPAKISVGENNSNIDFDLKALTDLNLPGYKLASNVNTDSLGFGVYDIWFYRRNLYTQENNNISLRIKRDKRSDTSENSFTEMYINFMSVRHPDIGMNAEKIRDQKERVVNHIKQLSAVSYTSTYLTFEKDLTMNELREMQFKYPDVNFIWAGIRTTTPGEPVNNITGFGLDFTGDPVAFDNPDEERYPAFNFLDWMLGNKKTSKTSIWAEGYEAHYTSLLKYMIDRDEAVNVLFYSNLKTEYYQSSLNYVEEHGVKTFGILAYANAQDIMDLIENEAIKTVELDQVTASKRYIH